MPKFRPPLWVLVWLVLLLLSGVVFFANSTAVDRLLDSVGLTALLYPEGKSLRPNVAVVPQPVPVTQAPETEAPLTETSPSPEPIAETPEPDSQPETAVLPGPTVAESAVGTPGPNSFQLYFSRLGPDGRMETASWYRELPAGMTPLTATLRALLLGPTLQEKSQGALTLMPPGTKLLSVRVHESTALLSFSEEFAHNTLGNEGLVGQLRQIVWTATQFPTVKAVQVLINGQYRDTLGDGEVSISQPLTRTLLP